MFRNNVIKHNFVDGRFGDKHLGVPSERIERLVYYDWDGY
jgi:hypothetical protein